MLESYIVRFVTSVVCCSAVLILVITKMKKTRNFTEILFFDLNPENSLRNLKKMVERIDSSCETLDLCLYSFTIPELSHVIVKKFKEGVKVRVIVDGANSDEGDSQIPFLRSQGVPVRMIKSEFHMHHKFAIVDSRILLNGSLNWSKKSIFSNHDHLVITTEPERIVSSFIEHFEYLMKYVN